MALPEIATPIYTLTVPSSKKRVKYRPFLVKEQKLLIFFCADVWFWVAGDIADITCPQNLRFAEGSGDSATAYFMNGVTRAQFVLRAAARACRRTTPMQACRAASAYVPRGLRRPRLPWLERRA